MSKTLEKLLTRRSVKANELEEPGPSAEQIEKIVAAGIRVPDHGKLAPWRVQVLDKAGQARLGDELARIFAADNPEKPSSVIDLERRRPQRAPVLLVVSAALNPLSRIPIMEQQLSGGAFCMNLLHAAHAMGFAAQWLTEWTAYHAEVKRCLGHDPDTAILGFIYIGTPKAAPSERGRPDPSEIMAAWPPAS